MSAAKKQKMGTQLEQLSEACGTLVVADTGDIDQIAQYKPTDATTNPSLILKAAEMEQYAKLVDEAVAFGKQHAGSVDDKLAITLDKLAVNFGLEILKIVPGYVSTEVDARLSFDKEANVSRGRRIIGMYEDAGVKRDRILIKLAATWEGFEAAKVLEAEGIRCNLTLLFSFAQAIAAGEAGVTLISPFVGRIMDWFKKNDGVDGYAPAEDPGVLSVTRIFNFYKTHGYKTIVMGASFRNKGEILQLAGCDRLTIGPKFLKELGECSDEVPLRLTGGEAAAAACTDAKISIDEKTFRFMLNEDAMATEKLAEGIRNFSKDLIKLENIIKAKLIQA